MPHIKSRRSSGTRVSSKYHHEGVSLPSLEVASSEDFHDYQKGTSTKSSSSSSPSAGPAEKPAEPTKPVAASGTDHRYHVEKYWLPPAKVPPFCLPGHSHCACPQNPQTQFTLVIDKSTIHYPAPPASAKCVKTRPVVTKKGDGSPVESPCPNFPIYINGILLDGKNDQECNNSRAGATPQFHNCAFYNFGAKETKKESKSTSASDSMTTETVTEYESGYKFYVDHGSGLKPARSSDIDSLKDIYYM